MSTDAAPGSRGPTALRTREILLAERRGYDLALNALRAEVRRELEGVTRKLTLARRALQDAQQIRRTTGTRRRRTESSATPLRPRPGVRWTRRSASRRRPMSEPAEDTGRVVRWSLRVGDRVVAGLDVAIPPVRTAADAWNAAALVGDAIERTLLGPGRLWPSAAGPPDDVDENLRESASSRRDSRPSRRAALARTAFPHREGSAMTRWSTKDRPPAVGKVRRPSRPMLRILWLAAMNQSLLGSLRGPEEGRAQALDARRPPARLAGQALPAHARGPRRSRSMG
jgi:hypothetical protein